MPKVDCIFVGCEAVLENGGIVNKIGTFTVALCARTFQKPFYVFTESLKFMKEFPLQFVRPYSFYMQDDALKLAQSKEHEKLDIESLEVDYTPPEYISLLFTSFGIFTPSAVSDELIKFFAN
jgi:translation initiation factor eIF-2B subunit alpha